MKGNTVFIMLTTFLLSGIALSAASFDDSMAIAEKFNDELPAGELLRQHLKFLKTADNAVINEKLTEKQLSKLIASTTSITDTTHSLLRQEKLVYHIALALVKNKIPKKSPLFAKLVKIIKSNEKVGRSYEGKRYNYEYQAGLQLEKYGKIKDATDIYNKVIMTLLFKIRSLESNKLSVELSKKVGDRLSKKVKGNKDIGFFLCGLGHTLANCEYYELGFKYLRAAENCNSKIAVLSLQSQIMVYLMHKKDKNKARMAIARLDKINSGASEKMLKFTNDFAIK